MNTKYEVLILRVCGLLCMFAGLGGMVVDPTLVPSDKIQLANHAGSMLVVGAVLAAVAELREMNARFRAALK